MMAPVPGIPVCRSADETVAAGSPVPRTGLSGVPDKALARDGNSTVAPRPGRFPQGVSRACPVPGGREILPFRANVSRET